MKRCAKRTREAEFINLRKGVEPPKYKRPKSGTTYCDRMVGIDMSNIIFKGLYDKVPTISDEYIPPPPRP